jgi:hypothetical protein
MASTVRSAASRRLGAAKHGTLVAHKEVTPRSAACRGRGQTCLIGSTMQKILDLVGKRYGRLTVRERRANSPAGKTRWLVGCDCGNTRIVIGSELTSGHTASCGCIVRQHGDAAHGKPSPEWKAWRAMRERCGKPQHKAYARYGGRGISVCDRWSIYENFLADMGRRTSPKHSLDRINNDGNYEPGNCRWATNTQQSTNRSSSQFLTLDGKRMTMSQWAKAHGMATSRLGRRLSSGWDLRRALTAPMRQTRKSA